MNEYHFSALFIGSLILFFIVVSAIAKFFNLESHIKDKSFKNKKIEAGNQHINKGKEKSIIAH